ncbi:WbqC-like protein family protein [Roseibium album]|nr:WbqC-like protein family protein [Roseibium album]
MTVVVVSQPMFVPWVGFFEQIHLADVFVHYDDVQLPHGRSFTTRVQVKTRNGMHWLTVPVDRCRSGSLINEALISDTSDWRKTHLETLRHAYAKAGNFAAMFALAERIYAAEGQDIADFNIGSTELISGLLGLQPEFARSSTLNIGGRGSERLISICRNFNASVYVTGHGAKNYLEHEAFAQAGIEVRYMNYATAPWPQLHGEFSPYVTILDLLAAVPFTEAADYLTSAAVHWRKFLADR